MNSGPPPGGYAALVGSALGGTPIVDPTLAPPAPDYATQVGRALGYGAPAPGPQPLMLGGRPLPSPSPGASAPPPTPPPTPPPPMPGPQGYEDPARGMSVSGAPPIAGGGGMRSGPPDPAPPPPQRFMAGGGGMVAAREMERRGPSLRHAQDARNDMMAGVVDRVGERGAQASAQEFAVALDQERQAHVRQEASAYSEAERAEEMAQRQADFDQSVKALSSMAKAPKTQFWADRSTPQAIAGIASVFIGGMLQGIRGGSNPGLDMVNQQLDREARAQEFAYNAALGTAQQKQTAFTMAMQKYNNVDAARAMTRAAALDAVQAQVAQIGAMWKGTEAASRADMAQAALQDEKMQQIAQGILFLPASVAPRMFVDKNTGLRYTEAEMKKRVDTDEEREFKRDEKGVDIAGQLVVKRAEHAGKHDDKTNAEVQHIANQLQTAGVPQARTAAEAALRAMNISEGGKAEAAARWGLGESLSRVALSDNANAREQAYQGFANAAMKAMMGNVTASEEERARKQFGAAADPESRRRAIASALDTLESIEKNAKSGASPEAQAEFDKRRTTAVGGPPAAPAGAKKGW